VTDDNAPRADRPGDPPAGPDAPLAPVAAVAPVPAAAVPPPPPPPPTAALVAVPPAAAAPLPRWLVGLVLLFAIFSVVALVFAWQAERRVRGTEKELVQRQEQAAAKVVEANALARQSQEGARDALAKVALLEARLSEVSVQRGQLEDLIQSVARARDESLAADIEAALRAAQQQSALTGSAEPLVAALRSADERLVRAAQPRLEPVRRAIARDLEKSKAAAVADVATLSVRIDEAVRAVDELPLLSAAEPRRDAERERERAERERERAGATEPPEAPPPAGESAWAALQRHVADAGAFLVERVWREVRSLVRVTRIDHPEAMLVAPDQAFFLKENLKLRLLNARLALLARQLDAAQADVRWAEQTIDRYFDRTARRTQATTELLRQIGGQLRQVTLPRPDESYAALAAAGLSPR
jgi:uroporphyrin-3 C-methyltransferase